MLRLTKKIGAIALLYPPRRVRVRDTVKLSAAFFHDESSIAIRSRGDRGGGRAGWGVGKCNSAKKSTEGINLLISDWKLFHL